MIRIRGLLAGLSAISFAVTAGASGPAALRPATQVAPAPPTRWREPVVRCLDTLIEHGTDHYGPVTTPMLMAILDLNTYDSPQRPPMLDANVRTEDRPDHGRRSPGGSNLWMDMPTLRVMYRVSELTGDAKYARAADAYIKSAFARAVKPNGLLAWGSHIYYDAYQDAPGGDGDGTGPHEILIQIPIWEEMYRVDPAMVRRQAEAIWKWHIVDKDTGMHNRHDDGHKGCDFAFSGGSFAVAFAFMYAKTGEPVWLDRARLVAGWHDRHRNPQTGLIPDAPSTGDRYDATHCFTTVTGPHASQLLRCYELTRDPHFRDLAVGYIRAYDRHGWNEQAGNYWGMLALDGTSVPEQPRGADYDVWKPTGLVDIWRTTMYSYEMPLIAAEASVYAYDLCDQEDDRRAMLEAARHWARAVAGALPPQPGRRWKKELLETLPKLKDTGGTYAENYGRAISFHVGLYHITGDETALARAEELAGEAIDKLYVNGLFRGHPAKDYYQANDGVGFLLHALLQLDALPGKWQLAF